MGKRKNISAVILASLLLTQASFALDASQLLDDEQTEAILQETRANEKYSCSPEDLANYIDVVSAPLKVRPALPSAKEHINNRAAEQTANGEEDCSMNFADMQLVKDLNKLIDKVKAFDPSLALPPSSEPIWPLIKQLSQQIYDALLAGVCGALTEELAMELVNEIMNHELGFDLKDVKKFDKNEFALDIAEDYLDEKGIDNDVLDPEDWEDMFGDHTGDIYDDKKGEMMDNMFE